MILKYIKCYNLLWIVKYDFKKLVNNIKQYETNEL